MRADGMPSALAVASATAFGSKAPSAVASSNQRPNSTSGSGSRSPSSKGRSRSCGMALRTLPRSAAATDARHRHGLARLQAALAGTACDPAERVAAALEVDPHAVGVADHAGLALRVGALVTATVGAREAGGHGEARVVPGGLGEVLVGASARDGARIRLAGDVADRAVELTGRGALARVREHGGP